MQGVWSQNTPAHSWYPKHKLSPQELAVQSSSSAWTHCPTFPALLLENGFHLPLSSATLLILHIVSQNLLLHTRTAQPIHPMPAPPSNPAWPQPRLQHPAITWQLACRLGWPWVCWQDFPGTLSSPHLLPGPTYRLPSLQPSLSWVLHPIFLLTSSSPNIPLAIL